MKCLKCNSDIKISQFASLTGYETYRCTNIECNGLFDISDFKKINSNLNKLIKPIFKKSDFDICFDDLCSTRYLNMPPGREISLFIAKILEANNNAIGVFPSENTRSYVSMRGKSSMNTETFEKFITDYKFYFKHWDHILIEEMTLNQERSLANLLEENSDFATKIYIIERSF